MQWALSPIADGRLNDRQGGYRGGVGTKNPGAETDRNYKGLGEEQLAFVVGKAALGADEDTDGEAVEVHQLGVRGVVGGAFVGEDQAAEAMLLLPSGDEVCERDLVGEGGDAEDFALLGGLDDIGVELVGFQARDLGEAGDDRLDGAGAHLGGLLYEVVE